MTLRRASNATTRAATVAVGPHAGRLLGQDETITSAETRLTYRIGRLLGQGGFGQVYLATRLGRSTTVPATVCIKVSPHINGWLREAYFGQLLGDHPRAIRVYDVFPLTNRPGKMLLYGLVLEYAQQGDLSAFLSRTSRKWSESAVRREIAGILEVLGKLHRGQLLHRDLTPLNVFVCDGAKLKLGDFGIVRQQRDKRGITARTLNPHVIVTRATSGRDTAADSSYLTRLLARAGTTPATCRQTRLTELVNDLDPKLAAVALGMNNNGLVRYAADNVARDRLQRRLASPP